MTEQDAHQILSKNCLVDVGKFYGAAGSLSLGVGLLYSAVRMPNYDVDERIFLTMEGLAEFNKPAELTAA